MNSMGAKISAALLGVLSILFISSSCCDDIMKLWAFAGRYSLSECQTLAAKHENPQNVILVCPGDDVTLFWYSSASQVQLDQGIGVKNSPDVEYPVISSNTTFKATPINSCAGSAQVSVKVIDKPTESTHIARWYPQCRKMGFEIEEEHYSENLVATSIKADFEFKDGLGNVCLPNTMEGKGILQLHHVEKIYNQYIMDYKVEESIVQSPGLQAIGHWNFTPQWQCAAVVDCNPTLSFPFKLMLECK